MMIVGRWKPEIGRIRQFTSNLSSNSRYGFLDRQKPERLKALA